VTRLVHLLHWQCTKQKQRFLI